MKLIVTLSAIVLTLSPAAFAQNTNPTGQPTGQSKSEAGAGGRSNSSADTAPRARRAKTDCHRGRRQAVKARLVRPAAPTVTIDGATHGRRRQS